MAVTQSQEDRTLAQRMGLNDTKAGMQGLDKDKINKIIMDASRGSKFYENEKRKNEQLQVKVDKLKQDLAKATAAQLKQCEEKADEMFELMCSELDLTRDIVHIDMDAYFASVEMRDDPSLRDVPMAVGSDSMLSTSNYAARRFGVRAAMPGFIAKKLCPQLKLVPDHKSKYLQESKIIGSVLCLYDRNVRASIDEASLDFTEHLIMRQSLAEQQRTYPEYSEQYCRCDTRLLQEEHEEDKDDERTGALNGSVEVESSTSDRQETTTAVNNESTDTSETNANSSRKCSLCGNDVNPDQITFGLNVEEAVREMRHRIRLKTRLTASAGISVNCMLSKICSDQNKPDGQFVLPRTVNDIHEFIRQLPIRKIPGIGKVSEKTLTAFDINSVSDFYTHRAVLYYLFSNTSFEYFVSVYCGVSSNIVAPSSEGPKSKSVERTFGCISEPSQLLDMCYDLSLELAEDLQEQQLKGKTITIKLKLIDFSQKTRAQSISFATNSPDEIYKVSSGLLKTEIKNSQQLKLRLMGVRVSNFIDDNKQQTKLKPVNVSDTKSFFDKIEDEKPQRTSDKPRLGLLGYLKTTSELKQMFSNNSFQQNEPQTTKTALQKFITNNNEKNDIWAAMDSEEVSPQKKAASRLQVESDNSLDPWQIFELSSFNSKSSNSSGPRGKGSLDSFVSKKTADSWATLDNTRTNAPVSSTPCGKAGRGHGKSTNQKAQKTPKFFKRTNQKSAWSSDSDNEIICVKDDPPTKRRKVESRKNVKRRQKVMLPVLESLTSRRPGLRERKTCNKGEITSNKQVLTVTLSSDSEQSVEY